MDNNILATVNGKEITEKDLQGALLRVPANQRSFYSSEQGKKQLLEQMIAFELMYNNAKENKQDEDTDFLSQLELIKKDALIQYSIQKLLKTVKVEDTELNEFYNANKEQFKAPETVSAKHILVETEDEAKKIAEEIKAGKSFEDAAKEYSKCPSKAQGGSLGEFGKGQMVPEFEEIAFTLEEGIVSEPVKTQFGYHLIKVENKKESSIKSFEEVKGMIYKQLLQNKQSKIYLDKVNELKSKFKVEFTK